MSGPSPEADPVVLVAALLHDTLEDTETTVEELTGAFGSRVAGIVEEVTDTKWLKKKTLNVTST